MLPTIWGIYAANIFESICKLNIHVSVGYSSLGMVVGAFGCRVGEYTFVKIWIYSANTLGNFFIIIYIKPKFWDECKLGSFCAPFRVRDTFFNFLFVFEITTIATQEIMTHHYL